MFEGLLDNFRLLPRLDKSGVNDGAPEASVYTAFFPEPFTCNVRVSEIERHNPHSFLIARRPLASWRLFCDIAAIVSIILMVRHEDAVVAFIKALLA